MSKTAFAVIIGLSSLWSAGAIAREVVPFSMGAMPGTIVIKTAERSLYFVRGDGTALRYKVAVGRLGKQWFGEARVDGKYVRPAWSPPDEVRRDNPKLPDVIPGGAPNNPMGARALTLDRGQYAIHGTNRPSSIGTYASYGCIRMFNEDIMDLFEQVGVGTRVVVER
ncbi:L,D-transpeptidase [Microvirga alba]|uniref:L,D-transpeptidase n=1 Tax=Microvirga alba TaxID=2791025 RepID=A0A931FRP0_9HYPH|nr:L,D-transpeptidase [Microvirga alba]MBF9232941.1 L,D-transpeptidase [Microvirga alba]